MEDAVYPLVIRAGGGSPRDSLSVLDQLLAGAGEEGVTYARALALLGVTDVALIDEAVDALAANDGAALFGTVDKVMDAGHDPRRFAVDLLERLRDLILMRAVPDAAERGLVDAPGDVLDRMREEAERIGPATLARYAELVHDGLGEMRGATAPRLLLEVMCARMLLPSATDAESAVLQRLERIEQGVVIAPTSGGAPAGAPAAAPRPAATEPPPSGPVYQRPSQRRETESAPPAQPEPQRQPNHSGSRNHSPNRWRSAPRSRFRRRRQRRSRPRPRRRRNRWLPNRSGRPRRLHRSRPPGTGACGRCRAGTRSGGAGCVRPPGCCRSPRGVVRGARQGAGTEPHRRGDAVRCHGARHRR